MDNLIQNWTVYRNLIPFIFVFLIVTAVVLMIAYQMKSKTDKKTAQTKSILEGCISLSFASIALFALMPVAINGAHSISLQISMVKLLQGDLGYILHLLMFIPLGLSIYLRSNKLSSTLLAGILTSAAVELVQYVLPIGRAVSLDAFILNALGTMIGAIAGILLMRRSIEMRAISKGV